MSSLPVTSSATYLDATVVVPQGKYHSPAAVGVSYRAEALFRLELEHGPNYLTVRDPKTGIFGQGEDVLAALQDFMRAAAEHRDVLERQPTLSEDLAAQLKYLRARVP